MGRFHGLDEKLKNTKTEKRICDVLMLLSTCQPDAGYGG